MIRLKDLSKLSWRTKILDIKARFSQVFNNLYDLTKRRFNSIFPKWLNKQRAHSKNQNAKG